MKPNNIELNAADVKAVLKVIIANEDRDGLWEFIREFFGVEIPRVAVCADHCAPFDFVADYLFGKITSAIVLGNRTGGKTLIFGILDTVMAFLSDDTEIATVGAIQMQALKGYEYFKEFSQKFPFSSNIDRFTMKKTTCKNESMVQVLTGTTSGVNSPHPQLLFLDEIDLMSWQVLQQAFSMPISTDTVESRTVVTSTRKFANGPMQRMLDEAEKREAKVYQWCVWETMKPLPVKNEKMMERIYKTFGSALPDSIDQAAGFYSWNDAINKYLTLDDDTWETEWICSRPGLKGVIYGSSFSDDRNVLLEWSPVGRRGYFYVGEDFGFGEDHPNVTLFFWIPPEFDRVVIFDEIYSTKTAPDDIWQEQLDKLAEYGLTRDNNGLILPKVSGWIPDPHELTQIADRKMRGAPILEKNEDASLYLIKNGIPLVKKFLQSGRLMQHDRCVNLRIEWRSYKKKKNLDGTFSDIPEKKNDHGPGVVRYFMIKFFAQLFANAFLPKHDDEAVVEIPVQQAIAPIARPTGNNTPITGDLRSNSW